ncbi:MAG: radical SAM protein [Clostridiales bacterium]|nr:MAG: radical SAM protein [Clostridiales bacterium]
MIARVKMDELLKNCMLCPRNCGVDRTGGRRGVCGAGEHVKAARAALHFWEEPCISGDRGSGTVFFSYCGLQCVYCQNRAISRGKAGKEISAERLAEIFLELQHKGAHNINLVTPTHYIPQIAAAVEQAKKQGLLLPIVYNTSGYEKAESIALLRGVIDIYLTDFKYMDEGLSGRYSGAPDYAKWAKKALKEMVEQAGEAVFDGDGMMQKGVIVRHLLLPGCLSDSKNVVRYLFETYGNRIFYSLMNQYTPIDGSDSYPELRRRVTEEEYEALIDFAVDLGVENGFMQQGGTAEESFIPPFDNEGI